MNKKAEHGVGEGLGRRDFGQKKIEEEAVGKIVQKVDIGKTWYHDSQDDRECGGKKWEKKAVWNEMVQQTKTGREESANLGVAQIVRNAAEADVDQVQ